MSEFFGRECSCYIPSDPFGHSPDCFIVKGKEKTKQMSKRCSCAGHGDHDPDCSLLELNRAWEATEVAGTVRGLTTLDDVVSTMRAELKELRKDNASYALQDKVEEIQTLIKELDDKVYLLLSVAGPYSLDAYDHLQQIHYKLTDCKGQLGAVKYALRKGTI